LHQYYLRVLAERGELNQLELSRRVGIASTTAVPAVDSMESRGLLKRTGRQLVEKLMSEVNAVTQILDARSVSQ
jgi:DNA-binding MarR family transcriptional regulator